ncbi:MAG: protein phosphatase CheZ [Pseudohongiellaceae bacterium]
MTDETKIGQPDKATFNASFGGFTPPLNVEQKSQLESQLLGLDECLRGAMQTLNQLHEPLYVHADTDLFKQPESNLLSYVKQLTACATANVLDILEGLPTAVDNAKNSNQEILKKLTEHGKPPKEFAAVVQELQEHLNSQNRMLQFMSAAHSDILSLHSFQDLASQAVIRAESYVGDIKNELEDAHKGLFALRDPKDASVEPRSTAVPQQLMENAAQMNQSDVDSLFASLKT